MEKEAILVIPHAYSKTAKIRAVELAHGLSQNYNVYCQKWNDIVHVNDNNLLLRSIKKIMYGIYSLKPTVTVSQDKGINYIELPLLQPALFHKIIGEHFAWEIARHINSRILKAVLKKFNPPILLISYL